MNLNLLHKNQAAFLIAILFYLSATTEKAHAQWVYVPDVYFRDAIAGLVPAAIVGDSLDTTNVQIINMTSLDVSGDYIFDLEGIEYFRGLNSLNCGSNKLTSLPNLNSPLYFLECSNNKLVSLPDLPQSLTELDCSNNSLDSLPNLPSNLITLTCNSNNLIVLPTLPAPLQKLDCDYNNLTSLPVLPGTISDIQFSNNRLTSLDSIPSSTTFLDCSSNHLTSLPILPDSLKSLVCDFNKLFLPATLPPSLTILDCGYTSTRTLPNLPSTLQVLECGGDSLTSLPALPDSLTSLQCGSNNLFLPAILPPSLVYLDCGSTLTRTLPNLPSTLQQLLCEGDSLTSLPALPNSLINLGCGYNMISCLPFLPESLAQLTGINGGYTCLPNMPIWLRTGYLTGPDSLCTPYNSTCYIYPRISGSLWGDDNMNSIIDSGETGRPNAIIVVQPGNYVFPTGDSTYYFYVVDTGAAYTITPNAIPYYNIVPSSYLTPALYFGAIDSLNNFALQRTGIVNDLSVMSTACEAAWRGMDMTHTLTATNNGTARASASVQYVFDPLLTYISSSPPADVVSGDTVQWNNIYLIPGQKADMHITFHLSAFTPDGTILTDYAVVNPAAGDTTPADNFDTLQQVVVGSYDPNSITVTPSGQIPITTIAAGQWLDYTVRFQNTGTDTALKVQVLDTLSSYLDLTTLQIISSSPAMTWSVRQRVAYFKFNAANLPDSSTDELASHGYVRYRLKANTNLSAGNIILSTGGIYFDSNAVVLTNTAADTVYELVTGVKSYISSAMSLYPNPVHDELVVNGKGTFAILNVLGQEMMHGAFKENEPAVLDVKSLSSGIYLIQMINEDGGMLVRKFVKE